MAQSSRSRRRRTREDWIDAAITFGAEVGFEKLAIEPLAASAGSTKGSVYWHFADRAALLEAVLERWERTATTEVTASIDPATPGAIETLLHRAVGQPHDRAELRMILASADERIGPVVERVHTARVQFIAQILRARGLAPQDAADRAHVAYAAYLGGLLLGDDAAESLQRAIMRIM